MTPENAFDILLSLVILLICLIVAMAMISLATAFLAGMAAFWRYKAPKRKRK